MATLKVQCYSGYKADERPVSFTLDDKNLTVQRIIDQWRGPDHEYFKVLADDGKGYLLTRAVADGEWMLEKVFWAMTRSYSGDNI